MSPLVGLGLSLALVIGGYVLAQHLEQRERLRSFLDGFVLVMVAGLCLLFILPHAFSALGGWAVGLMALGFLVPTLSERFLHRHYLRGRGRRQNFQNHYAFLLGSGSWAPRRGAAAFENQHPLPPHPFRKKEP